MRQQKNTDPKKDGTWGLPGFASKFRNRGFLGNLESYSNEGSCFETGRNWRLLLAAI